MLPQLLVILVPSFLLFDDVMAGGAAGWLTVAWVLVLGMLAMMPLGMIIGALVPSTQKVGTWGMLPVLVLAGISGIFYPVQQLWGWVQVVAQIFPMYWLGLGMRSAFLPDSAAALEIGGSWRTLETVLVLGAWAVAGAARHPARAAAHGPAPVGLAGRGRARQAAAAVDPMSEACTTASPGCAPSRASRAASSPTALGVHYQTVGYLERGEYNPSLHLALRIAAFFGVPVEVVFSLRPFPRLADEHLAAPARD